MQTRHGSLAVDFLPAVPQSKRASEETQACWDKYLLSKLSLTYALLNGAPLVVHPIIILRLLCHKVCNLNEKLNCFQ